MGKGRRVPKRLPNGGGTDTPTSAPALPLVQFFARVPRKVKQRLKGEAKRRHWTLQHLHHMAVERGLRDLEGESVRD